MDVTRPGLTLPQVCRCVGITRARAERLLFVYRDRLPVPVRVGITRLWPPEVADQVRMIVAEEDRLREAAR